MKPIALTRRSLTYHWRTNIAVVLGVIAAAAALTGALLVGDSLRGSLRDLALQRLQRVEGLVRGNGLFREALADDLQLATAPGARNEPGSLTTPVLLLRGAAKHADTQARANQISILGIRDEFWRLGWRNERPGDFDGAVVALNESLARQLGARAGDDVLLRFERISAISSETLMGKRDDRTTALRLRVAAILPDGGVGGLSLSFSQRSPLNAIVPLDRLQRELDQTGRANLILCASLPESSDAARSLDGVVQLADYGLHIRTDEARRIVSLEPDAMLLPPNVATSAMRVTRELGAEPMEVIAYLANDIRLADNSARSIPYSTVAAISPTSALTDQPLRPGEILLNQWAADNLAAQVGAKIELDYYVTSAFGALETRSAMFTLRGIVPLAGAAADPGFVPEFKGVTDTRSISDWDPPFPVDLKKVRDQDEAYWDHHRTTPKAFLTLEDGRRLWSEHGGRFGELTSIRVRVPESSSGAGFARELEQRLLHEIKPAELGLRYEPVRELALAASRGATDFGGLFIGFSFFVIVSAALLVALLFRLSVERRAAEIGVLLATGFARRQVFWMLLREGALLATIGATFGLLAACGYAWLMLAGLRTWWSAAVNAPFLSLHAGPLSLAMGWIASVAVALIAVAFACRGLTRLPPRGLLAGQTSDEWSAVRPRRARAAVILAVFAPLIALALLAASVTGVIPQPAGFFGGAALLLFGGIAAFRVWLRREPRVRLYRASPMTDLHLGLRSARRAPGRSLATVALLATASFLIVALGAFRLDPTDDVTSRAGGAGGFALYAESATPLIYDLATPAGRDKLGLADSEPALRDPEIVPFRLQPGDEASCLNLYQRSQPRILGAPQRMIDRGGFSFAASQSLGGQRVENPWALLETPLDGAIPAIGDEAAVKWQLHSGLGQDLIIRDERGQPATLRFVALLSGSALQDELIVSEASFTRLFPSRSGYSFFLIDTTRAPTDLQPSIEQSLEQGLSDFGFDVRRTRDRLRDYLAVQNTYLSTFQLLGGVGLMLGALGLVAVLLRTVWERRRELALLRAVGFTRRSIRRIVLAELLALAAIGLLLGVLPALLAVAPLALERPANIPWATLAATLACVAGIAIVAAIVALRPTLRAPLLPALRGE